MEFVSARDFRSNQSSFLSKALNGETIFLSSKLGIFKIEHVNEDISLTERICNGLRQVKLIEDGKLPKRTINDILDEL